MDPIGDVGRVVERLEHLVARCQRDRSRIGYFAALYLRVTRELHDALEAGRFADAEWVSSLDLAFAGRYFGAVDAWQERRTPGGALTRTWALAFERCADPDLPVIDQLILGCGAHMGVDLPAAVADVTTADALDSRKGDFDLVNTTLGGLTPKIEADLARTGRHQAWLVHLAPRLQSVVFALGIRADRALGWHDAARFAATQGEARQQLFDAHDRVTDEALRVALAALGPVDAWLAAGQEQDPAVVIETLLR